jgi:hypothetical protein
VNGDGPSSPFSSKETFPPFLLSQKGSSPDTRSRPPLRPILNSSSADGPF